jgi:hypothetical protein
MYQKTCVSGSCFDNKKEVRFGEWRYREREEDAMWWSLSASRVANGKLEGGAESAEHQWPVSNNG